MSSLAEGARITLSRAPDSGTVLFCLELSFGFGSYLADKSSQFLHRIKLDTIAAVDLVQTLLDGTAEPCKLGLVFRLALFEKAQALAHHFAGVAEAARGNAGFDEAL